MYGSFGALLVSNEQAFGVARDTISFGMSALSATLGFSALGREVTYLLFAAVLLPVLYCVLRYLPGSTKRSREADAAHVATAAGAILRRLNFWLISLGIALLAGCGTAYMVHAIPYAHAEGMGLSASALILSAYSAAGFLGVPLFGWLADKIGAPRALALAGLVQCLSWAGLALSPAGLFLPLSAMLGIATTPLTTLHGAAMAQLFGAEGASKSLGYSFAIKLPFPRWDMHLSRWEIIALPFSRWRFAS